MGSWWSSDPKWPSHQSTAPSFTPSIRKSFSEGMTMLFHFIYIPQAQVLLDTFFLDLREVVIIMIFW